LFTITSNKDYLLFCLFNNIKQPISEARILNF